MRVECFLDTNVLVYAASSSRSEAAKRERALKLVQETDFGLSAQVLQEFYVTVTRKMKKPSDATALCLRELNKLDAHKLPGTEGAESPFFSRDGRSVGFFANKKLQRIDLAGGPPRELADVADPRGGSWGAGVIVFAPSGGGPLLSIRENGGEAVAVTRLKQAIPIPRHSSRGVGRTVLSGRTISRLHHGRIGA